jgi:hypothetical protein
MTAPHWELLLAFPVQGAPKGRHVDHVTAHMSRVTARCRSAVTRALITWRDGALVSVGAMRPREAPVQHPQNWSTAGAAYSLVKTRLERRLSRRLVVALLFAFPEPSVFCSLVLAFLFPLHPKP